MWGGCVAAGEGCASSLPSGRQCVLSGARLAVEPCILGVSPCSGVWQAGLGTGTRLAVHTLALTCDRFCCRDAGCVVGCIRSCIITSTSNPLRHIGSLPFVRPAVQTLPLLAACHTPAEMEADFMVLAAELERCFGRTKELPSRTQLRAMNRWVGGCAGAAVWGGCWDQG